MHVQRIRAPRNGVRLALILGLAILALAAAAAVTSGATDPTPTRGRIPAAAMQPGQPMDAELIPDFVTALDRQGNPVGYVPKSAVIAQRAPQALTSGAFQPASIPVYGEDLTTIVGWMVPDKGFVPAGTDPADVPGVDVKVGPGE